MSVAEKFMQVFSGVDSTPPAPSNTPVMPTGTSIPAQPGVGTSNGIVPNDLGTPVTPAPLDNFKDLWNTTDKKDPQDTSYFGSIDGDALLTNAQKMDFLKDITPEQRAAMEAGGPEGMQAMLAAMAKVSQRNYAQSAYTTTQLIEKALASAEERFQRSLPTHIRNHTANTLIQDDPAFKHPAAKPMVDMLVGQFQTKFPNATPNEINQMAKDYFKDFVATVQGGPSPLNPNRNKQAGTDGDDWEDFFNR